MRALLLLAVAFVCAASADRVRVRLYMEAQCPVCIQYMTNTMVDVFNCKGIDQIADIGVIPYGNANLRSDGSISCQHGSGECASNLLMSCAINLYNNNFATYFPFLHCLEVNNGHPGAGRQCANQAKLNWGKIKACAQSNTGREWQLQMARRTQRANNDYTPWVVVNGQVVTSENKADNLLSLICSTYTGSNKPSCCSAQEEATTSSVAVHSQDTLKVCWKSNERKSYYLRDHSELTERQQQHDPISPTADDEETETETDDSEEDVFDREADEEEEEEEMEKMTEDDEDQDLDGMMESYKHDDLLL